MSRPPAVLLIELNEADGHFLDKWAGSGRLPAFQRMLDEGVRVMTRVPGWDGKAERAWRDISPWIVWPSVYTGMTPEEHGIVGFGQDTTALQGRCVWDVLDSAGVSTGVFGSLMSYPPRTSGAAEFYVPEALADDADCLPDEARPLQEFNIFAARNYSGGFGGKRLHAVRLLLGSMRSGVSAGTVLKTLWQVPAEKLRGAAREPERALLQTYMGWDAFSRLYRRHRPAFATFHCNHVAYLQHRYWRAAEPERYSPELNETDRRFFETGAARSDYERKFAHWIETGFVHADEVLGRCMEMVAPGTVVLLATGLGQRPFDPTHEIHNPVVRLIHAEELFDAIGLRNYELLHQMNPDVTVNLATVAEADAAAERARGLHVREGEPLFAVSQRGRQLFLELDMPRRQEAGERIAIRHRALPDFEADLARHVEEHGTNDQSTAHHKDAGLLLAWRRGGELAADRRSVPVTDVAPTILSLFDLPAPDWMRPSGSPAVRVVANGRGADG